MIGRLAPGPKPRTAMPGSFRRASPKPGADSLAMSNESTVVTALNASNVVSVPPAEAVTVTSSCTGERLSSKSAVTTPPGS